MSDASLNHVDVLLVGGGPASLLITSVLVRSGLKILTVGTSLSISRFLFESRAPITEQYDKFEQGLYGRACMLYAGSLEILDLIGVYDRIADIGFTVRRVSATTFKDGIPTASRGWSFIENALERNKTMFDFSYPVIATIEERGKCREIHWYSRRVLFQLRGLNEDISTSKYLVGADGGRSTVRSLGNFSFTGTASPHKWVRLDAIVTTNMPSSRSKAIAIESKKYGNILWTPTDNGRTRIGFICQDEIFGDRGSNITAEIIMEVAKEALLPFTLDFVKLDWWTVYEIGQRVAGTFRDGPVFLAGDAAHTHSSGAAQEPVPESNVRKSHGASRVGNNDPAAAREEHKVLCLELSSKYQDPETARIFDQRSQGLRHRSSRTKHWAVGGTVRLEGDTHSDREICVRGVDLLEVIVGVGIRGYGVDQGRGAIVVLRPDGVVSFKTTLDGAQDLSNYFDSFVRVRPSPSEKQIRVEGVQVQGPVGGEIDVEGEEEPRYS
ncbi:FAD binding domain-containing protein [Mycena sp. CBHHK59/15]|nr:FAD binding domain-containing protein [Mycena sp. CBHHK59/15]